MDPFPPPPQPWNPDDDFLLKNSVESGASLESLAKGAVSFSRRYSLKELRERWYSLLYNSDVSDVASAAMVNLELAKINGNGIKEVASIGVADRKRKSQTIRKCYYAMRKRLRTEVFFNSFDMAMRDEMCVGNYVAGNEIVGSGVGNGNGSLDKDVNNNLPVNSLVNCGNQLGLEGAGAGSSHSMSEDPLWKTMEDVSAPNMPIHVGIENENEGSESKEIIPPVSDDLLNLPNEGELMVMSIGEKDETAEEKQCDNNADTILLCSPCAMQGNDMVGVGESEKLVVETKLDVASGSAELEVVANSVGSSHGDSGFIADRENEVQSSGAAAAQSPDPKPAKEFRICSLNTEDPNIPSPSNDIVVHDSVAPKPISIVKEVGYPDSFISNQINEPDGSLKKKDSSSAVSEQKKASSKENPVAALPKTENSANNLPSEVVRQINNVIMKQASYEYPKQEVVIALPSPVNVHPKEEEHKTSPTLEAKLLGIDQEGGNDDSDSDANDDEEEIPCFSDVEEMILDMDLGPTDQDTDACAKVMRYQDEGTKRTIMRLEQCAHAFMQRKIASRGAFAVLSGHAIKEYIDKPEVIIGRSTSDIIVDVDLGRTGQSVNKISRRQASITMDENGSFFIKNLGKTPIFLNGKEIAKGQVRGLSSGSLIMIRSWTFIFDVNKECVQMFLDNVNE